MSNPSERSPEAVLPQIVRSVAGMKGEVFLQLSLGASGDVVDVEVLACAVHPKERLPVELLFERPKQMGASTVMFASNIGTSGLDSPRPVDIDFARRLVAAGEVAGIPVIDHYLVAPDRGFISLRMTTDIWGN